MQETFIKWFWVLFALINVYAHELNLPLSFVFAIVAPNLWPTVAPTNLMLAFMTHVPAGSEMLQISCVLLSNTMDCSTTELDTIVPITALSIFPVAIYPTSGSAIQFHTSCLYRMYLNFPNE
jgi:hypothetical protein